MAAGKILPTFFLALFLSFLAVLVTFAIRAQTLCRRSILVQDIEQSLSDAKGGLSGLWPTSTKRSDFLALLSDTHLQQARRLPRFTKHGCLLVKLPRELKSALIDDYRKRRWQTPASPEPEAALVEFSSEDQAPLLTWVAGSAPERKLRGWLRVALARWSGLSELEHTATYGVRTYRKGSKLTPHTDRFMTHVVSAIVHIERTGLGAEGDWPLHVLPHDAPFVFEARLGGEQGPDCLFYESCTVPHGRLTALQDEEYSNIFFHYMPPGWGKQARDRMGEETSQ